MNDIEDVLKELCNVELPDTFNPYRDRCPAVDLPDAPQIRLKNLAAYINAVASQGDVEVWVGRDLGYRGGRRTGLALTDEAHLQMLSDRIGHPVNRATNGPCVAERTAAWIWRVIGELPITPFLWNSFPLHPHERDHPFSNRSHTRSEFVETWDITAQLLRVLRPSRLIAIGNDAARNLEAVGIECHYVRHPSYGGQSDFLDGITKLYRVHQGGQLFRQGLFARLN